jgi:monothiol glutaredoxin
MSDLGDTTQARIDQMVKGAKVMLFMKGTPDFPQCGFSMRAVNILRTLGASFESFNVLEPTRPCARASRTYADWPTIPQLYVERRVRRRLGHHDGDVRRRFAAGSGQGVTGR